MPALVVWVVTMLNAVQRRFSVLFLFSVAGLIALLCGALQMAMPTDGGLAVLPSMAFGAAVALYLLPMIETLQIERVLRPDPPFWRLRMAVVGGYFWFVMTVVGGGMAVPSGDALGWLISAAIFGGGMAWVWRKDWAETWLRDSGAVLYDLDRPVWATVTGDWMLRLWGVVLFGAALLVSLVDLGSKAYSVFVLILVSGPMLSYPMRNLTRWRERDLATVVAVACLLTGLFTG